MLLLPPAIIIIIIIIITTIIIIIIIMLKRAAQFAKWASCEIRYLELYNWKNGMEERWIGVMTEYPKTRNAVLYEKNVSKNGIAIK